MQARKIMKAMGISPFGAEVNKLRELIHFHLTMGASEAEIPKLVEQKANDVRVLQQGTLSERKKQAVQFMWQRYRDQWPVASAAYKAKSKSGYTNNCYSSVGGSEAPPGWCFIVHERAFALTQAHNLREIIVTRADLLAEFMPEPEKHSVKVTTYEPEAISVAEIATEPVIMPPKREGKQTQTKTRPDQFSFATSVKYNCFDKCVVTGSRIHSRCSAAHLVEHKGGGADYYTNGLWMRCDIHNIFDDGWCAICPTTMQLYFLDEAIELDPDLAVYQGKYIINLRRPINSEFLLARWATFEALRCEAGP